MTIPALSIIFFHNVPYSTILCIMGLTPRKVYKIEASQESVEVFASLKNIQYSPCTSPASASISEAFTPAGFAGIHFR